jgi:hypothetical protein
MRVAVSRAPGAEGVVTPLELFFDLVYVFAIGQLSHHLLEHVVSLSLQGGPDEQPPQEVDLDGRFPTPRAGTTSGARVYRRSFDGRPGEPMYRPGLLAQEATKAARLRRIPARRRVRGAENSPKSSAGRRSFVHDRPASAGRPAHPALARTGPGGPSEPALRRRKPGAEPTSALLA